MVSMFQRGQSKLSKKRPHGADKSSKKASKKKSRPVKPAEDEDEEIASDLEDEVDQDVGTAAPPQFVASDNDYEDETPAQKKLRLAKQYLAEIQEEESDDDGVSQRLKDAYLDEHGKLRRNVATQYTGFGSVDTLKHRFQKLPLICACFSNSDTIVYTGCKSEIVLKWQIDGFTVLGKIDLKKGNPEAKGRRHAQCMAISGTFLAIGDASNDIQVYNSDTLKRIGLLKGHRGIVTALVFRKTSNQLYTASVDRSIRIWSMDEMTFVEALFGHQTPITGVDALTRERAISSGGNDRSIRIWKIVEESQLVYQGHEGSIEDVKLLNDEHFISCGGDGQICVWNVSKKKPLAWVKLAHGRQETGEPNWISAIGVFLNTDLIASGSCDGYIRLWHIDNNFTKIQQLFSIPVTGFVNHLNFIRNGEQLAACVGQEHHLGRWWRNPEAKNCLQIIELKRDQ